MRSRAILFLLLTFPLSAQTRSVIVEFRTPTALAQFRRDFTAVRAESKDPGGIRYEYSQVFFGAAIRVDASEIAHLRALPYVAAIHDDAPLTALGGVAAAALGRRMHTAGSGGQGITIAIIDSGVDYNHPALRANYAGGHDFVNDDDDPLDDSGHGTHVAGVALSVAPDATIVAYKVLNAAGQGFPSDFLAALEHAATDRVQILNASLGFLEGSADHFLSRAVDNAVAAGIVAVVAAGNDGNRGVGTINTPATSRRAITVAALDAGGNDAAFFTSRGPTPGLQTFKPDIAAPGVNVVSAKLGGGTIAFTGSSVAAPRVAGAAALVLASHPDWTPDRVKSALVRAAAPANGDPFARGAGKLDVAAAANATLEVSETGLSFGGNGELTGTRTESRRFTIANRGTQRQMLTLSAANTPTGCTITIAPPSLDLAPGQSAEVTVQLVTDNASLRPPSVAVVSGDIVAGTLTIPWAFVRGGRATTHDDGLVDYAVAFGDRFRTGVRLDDSNFEYWLPANVSQDFVILTGTQPPRLMTIEHRVIADDVVSFNASQATLKLELQGRDRDGARLADKSDQFVRLRLAGANGFLSALLPATREILATPFPSRMRIDLAEVLVDGRSGYVVQHKPMQGLTANVALTNETYVNARLRMPDAFSACAATVELATGALTTDTCVTGDASAAFDLYTTPEVNPDRYFALYFEGDTWLTPPFRASNGTIVALREPTAPAATHRIAHGSESWVGAGPFFPNRFFGATDVAASNTPPRGFTGPLGEERFAATSTAYITARGASGSLDNPSFQVPSPATGDHVRVIGDLKVAGRPSRGQLDVQFGSNATDLIAPTISSLQLLGTNGNPTERLQRGDAASLRFAAADYAIEFDVRTRVVKTDATRVYFRVSGTKEWRALTATHTGSEIGVRGKSLPSGDLYSVDLSDATAIDNVTIDLRIDLEDIFGNRMTWTQEPAFVVGSPAAQPKRRSK